ncbi:UPF0223 family protein [Sporosarcina jiandibaonis]|uniref:UPF0223 family protein n=1 Tax=Sporosarcina jiandibaonis TaxID=2715535 RepID=UPI001554C1B9|nr:UPF0223 family protein [Sporosarcina jiandibaonis]
MEYSYPLRTDWSTEEIISVVAFYEIIEQAYEDGAEREKIMNAYREFKKVVPSKAEEKTLFKEFEEASVYSSYHIVKSAENAASGETIKGTLK